MTNSTQLHERLEKAERALKSLRGKIPYTPPECIEVEADQYLAYVLNILDPEGRLVPKPPQYYAIHAVLHRTEAGWNMTKQFATFYLNENVQGCMDERMAERIARRILDPFEEYGDRLHITAYKQ